MNNKLTVWDIVLAIFIGGVIIAILYMLYVNQQINKLQVQYFIIDTLNERYEKIDQFDERIQELDRRLKKLEEKINSLEKSSYDTLQRQTGLSYATIDTIFKESEKYDINPYVIIKLIETESNFNPNADNGIAAGLCQINYKDGTAKWLWSHLFPDEEYSKEKLYDSVRNIKLGAFYISYLLKRYDGDYHKALSAYYAGPSKGLSRSRYSEKILNSIRDK